MKAGKAYISSLGTTGLLVASSLILLVVVGALIAFDAWPSGESVADPDTIAIADKESSSTGAAAKVVGGPGAQSAAITRQTRIARRERAQRRRATTRGKKNSKDGGPAGGRPVTGGSGAGGSLPDPRTSGDGSAGVGGLRGGPVDVTAVPNGSETVRHIGAGVSVVSPEAGSIVQQTGDAVVGVVNGLAEQILPGATGQSANGTSQPLVP